MSWLAVAIISYLLFAIASLVDKYLLRASIPNPKVYVFYVGVLGVLIIFLAPFVDFFIPSLSQIILALLAGAVFIFSLYWFFKTIQSFEISRVVPAIGGLTPLFTFLLVYIFALEEEVLSLGQLSAFILLLLGSVLMNIKRGKIINLKSLKYSAITALSISLFSVLIKYVYLSQPFWNGFIWRSIGSFLVAACLFPEIRKEIFPKEKNPCIINSKKTALLFLSNQVVGSGATILQNWAIFLAPLVSIPIIQSLVGVQYAFLFILSILLSLWFPKILKEEISKGIILQKIVSILLISGGLILLAI